MKRTGCKSKCLLVAIAALLIATGSMNAAENVKGPSGPRIQPPPDRGSLLQLQRETSRTTSAIASDFIRAIETGGVAGANGCHVPCGDGFPENEANCGLPSDTSNGGCNSEPPVFTNISCGEAYCGTAGYDGGTRDTDWYKLILTDPTDITFSGSAEFPMVIGVVNNSGIDSCVGVFDFMVVDEVNPCEVGSVTTCLSPGTWYLFVAPQFIGNPFDCGAQYTVSLTCEESDCVTGACCVDGSCSQLFESTCDTLGGIYFGDESDCAEGFVLIFNEPNVAIPDFSIDTPGSVSNTMMVSESFTISDVEMDLRILHTFVGDLIVTIEHLGTTVDVIVRPGLFPDLGCCGCDENNYDIILDDEGAGGAIEDQCVANLTSPPSYTPNNPLSAFDGLNSAGSWTITVTDNAGIDVGTLQRWSLAIIGNDECPGACCEEGDPCEVTSPFQCLAQNGAFFPGVTCETPLTCPDDVTIECDGSTDPSATGVAIVGGCLEVGYRDEVEVSETCAQTGTITRTWYVINDKGETTCTQIITVADTTPPVIECSRDVIERCINPSGVPVDFVDIGAIAEDNCSKPSNCCTSGHGEGCETAICEAAVCACDPFCCESVWDDACASTGFGGGCGAQLLCGTLCEAGSCCVASLVPGCNDEICEAIVCAEDPSCCDTTWDSGCVSQAIAFCGDLCTGEEVEITDNRPEDYFPPTCGEYHNVVTFTATDECGNMSTCDVDVAVVGAMCCPGETDTDLKLMITDLDLRQDTDGPITTKARFDIWNSNEVRFSGTERCITCWDETLISDYGPIANHLILANLQTDKGKARIQNEGSTVCPESTEGALLGVAIKETQFLGSPFVEMRSAVTLVGMGEQAANIQYDIIANPEEANDGGLVISQVPGVGGDPTASLNDDGGTTVAGAIADNRASTTFKGSLVTWPVIEVKWDQYGSLIQDTFITIVNDNPGEVKIQFYQVNGDAPLDPVFCCDPEVLVERAHPGWNWSDYQITLTGDESAYWSVASGLPKGVSPISVLDPGSPHGRPDLDPSNPGGRVIRGFLVGWAVNDDGAEIRWNHLKGHAVSVRYDEGTAFDYNPWNFRVVSGVPEGAQSDGIAGNLNLDGVEYDFAPETLLFDFFAAGTQALSHPDAANFENDD